MIPALIAKQDQLAQLCRAYGVVRLEVFGSAADDSFDPARSDVDLIVEFQPGTDLGPWLTRYFQLRDKLAALLGRAVDLAMASALRDPHFIHEANRTRKLLYAC